MQRRIAERDDYERCQRMQTMIGLQGNILGWVLSNGSVGQLTLDGSKDSARKCRYLLENFDLVGLTGHIVNEMMRAIARPKFYFMNGLFIWPTDVEILTEGRNIKWLDE